MTAAPATAITKRVCGRPPRRAPRIEPGSGGYYKKMLRVMRPLPFLMVFLSATVSAADLPSSDAAAVRAATQEYRNAWLANDAGRVMATLTPDAIILPSGLAPIEGQDAIRRFWFPTTGPATTVTAMELTIDEVNGSGDLAVVRGRGTLTFKTAGSDASTSLRSTFLNILRRRPDGRWLIARRMWSDLRD